MLKEILALTDEVAASLKTSCALALKIGLRLLVLHRQTGESESEGGFKAAEKALAVKISRATYYRWINAAATVLARHQGVDDAERLKLPEAPGTINWTAAEKVLDEAASGMSLRRLIVGHSAISDESRQEALIAQAEDGDSHAEEVLALVAQGKLTLVQAIRAQAGAKATRDKVRADPVYLDIDSVSGQPVGLVPKCLVTLANAFARWDSLDETARHSMRASWKALVADLPRELR